MAVSHDGVDAAVMADSTIAAGVPVMLCEDAANTMALTTEGGRYREISWEAAEEN